MKDGNDKDSTPNQCREISDVVLKLDNLANSFADTGNWNVCTQLRGFAKSLYAASEHIRTNHKDAIMESFQVSLESSDNLLKMGLAMTDKGEKN